MLRYDYIIAVYNLSIQQGRQTSDALKNSILDHIVPDKLSGVVRKENGGVDIQSLFYKLRDTVAYISNLC